MNIRNATHYDTKAVEYIWISVFNDTPKFVNNFLTHFGIENILLCEEDEQIKSMLFVQKTQLNFQASKINYPLHYIYACATLPQFRGKGLMEKLLEKAFQNACAENAMGTFLTPASEQLANYYRKLAFTNFFNQKVLICNRNKIINDSKINNSSEISGSDYFEKRNKLLFESNYVVWSFSFFSFLKTEGYLFFQTKNSIYCYTKSANNIQIHEFLGNDSVMEIVSSLFHNNSEIESISVIMQGNEKVNALVRWNNDLAIVKPLNGYFAFPLA